MPVRIQIEQTHDTGTAMLPPGNTKNLQCRINVGTLIFVTFFSGGQASWLYCTSSYVEAQNPYQGLPQPSEPRIICVGSDVWVLPSLVFDCSVCGGGQRKRGRSC